MSTIDPEAVRQLVARICERFPEAHADSRTGQHTAFEVRGRRFAYYTVDHHGDGRLALSCKAAPGVQQGLVAADPERFFVPPYLGPRGWAGVYLDVDDVDWAEVEGLLREAYLLTAPKRLAASLRNP